MRDRDLIRAEVIILVLAVLPNVVHFGISETQTVNGVVASDYTLNVAGVILAGIALAQVGSAWSKMSLSSYITNRSIHRIVLMILAAFAFFQVLRSCGVFSMAAYYLAQ